MRRVGLGSLRFFERTWIGIGYFCRRLFATVCLDAFSGALGAWFFQTPMPTAAPQPLGRSSTSDVSEDQSPHKSTQAKPMRPHLAQEPPRRKPTFGQSH